MHGRTARTPPGKADACICLYRRVAYHADRKKNTALTFNFGVGALFPTANVNEIKGCHSLREARSELPNGGLTLHSTAGPRYVGEPGQIGDESGGNLDAAAATGASRAMAVLEDSISQGVGGLFSAFDPLLNKSFLELDGWAARSVSLRVRNWLEAHGGGPGLIGGLT